MTTIGSTPPSLRYTDRTAYVQQVVAASNGMFTVEEIRKREEESDRIQLQAQINTEKFINGEGTYLGSSRGNQFFWNPEGRAQALVDARKARTEHYSRVPDYQYSINALNIDSVLGSQVNVTGGELRDLTRYADYLRNEVSAATEAKADFTFSGAWGKDRTTSDVGEYIKWLYQAIQEKSEAPA